jgi:hypothetical protein
VCQINIFLTKSVENSWRCFKDFLTKVWKSHIYGLTMEVSTVNYPGFVFCKFSLIQFVSRGFVLSNGIKHCYIATMRKMLNNFVWALLLRYQLVALFTIYQWECDLALSI